MGKIVSLVLLDEIHDINRFPSPFLFDDYIILYGFYSFDAPCDFTRLIDGLLRINEAAQLDGALVRFYTDLKSLEKVVLCKQRFYLCRDDRIVNVSPVLARVDVDAQPARVAISMRSTKP